MKPPLAARLAHLALASLSWQFNYLLPYAHAAIDYTTEVPSRVSHQLPASPPLIAFGYFLAFTVAGYGLYVGKSDRG